MYHSLLIYVISNKCVQNYRNTHKYNYTNHYDLNNKHVAELSPFWQCQYKLWIYNLVKV